jgi:hypothetical protein
MAVLRWVVARPPGSAQQVALTMYREGFEKGKFEMSRQLPPDQTSLQWEKLQPGIYYHWRVLTRQGKEWVASETSSFQAPICVADYVTPQAP